MGAERLVKTVGNLHLAIDQVASYIRASGIGFQVVLVIYQSGVVPEVLEKGVRYAEAIVD